MKNKVLLSMMAALMTAAMLTACGGDKEAKAPAASTTEEAAPETEEKTEEADTSAEEETDAAADGDMVSDEVFEILQDNYALLVEAHDAVAEAYNSDEIAANADIEDAMNQAYDIILEMGEVTQENITESDAIELNDAMADILEVLSMVVDGMEVTEGGAEMVSDETFAAVQENYEDLTIVYNIVADAYNNGDVKDADIEDAMNQAREIIEEMGTILQDNLTEEDAENLVDLMVQIVEVLGVVADSVG